MLDAYLVLGVVDQSPSGPPLDSGFRMQPAGVGTESDWVEVLAPDLEVGGCCDNCSQIQSGHGGNHPSVGLDSGHGDREFLGRRAMGGLVGLEIDNDQAVAHETASGEFPLTVPGNGEAEILISASMDYPLMKSNASGPKSKKNRMPRTARMRHMA